MMVPVANNLYTILLLILSNKRRVLQKWYYLKP